MNVKALHINTRLELDKINSSLYDYLTDEEIDYYLNKAQTEFIKQRYNPESNQYRTGFEQNEKRTADLKNLHVTNYSDTCYLTNEANKYRFRLPEDFMYLTSQQTSVYYNYCAQIVSNTITSTKTYFEVPLAFNTLLNESFSNFRLAITSTSNSLISSITNYNYPEDQDNYIIRLRNSVILQGYSISFEGFYTLYSQNTLFIEAPISTTLFVSYDGGTNWTSFSSKTLTLQNVVGVSNGTREVNVLRRCQIDDLYVLLKDSFATTNPEYPLAIEQSNYIDSYANSQFIIEQLIISYIRQPKPISLSLNQTSELASPTHPEIVAMAVNMCLEAIESRRYETNNLELKRIE